MRSEVVGLALLAGSCGVGELDDITVSAEGPLPVATLAHCERDGPKEPPSPYEGWDLLLPSVWLRVDAIDADGARIRERKSFPGTYVVVGGDPEVVARFTPAPRKVRLDGYAAKAAEAMLRAGASVFVHHGPEHVRSTVAFRGDEFTFLGDCGSDGGSSLRRYLGPAAGPYMRSFVGSSSLRIKRLLGYSRDVDPRNLHHWWSGLGAHSPPGVLASLRTMTLVVKAPGVRRGNELLCFWIPLGGSGCTTVRDPKPTTLYVDPGRTEFDVVMRTPGSPMKQQRGTLDLWWAARRGGVKLSDPRPMRLTVTLSADPKSPYKVETAVMTPVS
ncbi:MAG TPA: hypothetical protein VNQ77_13540 [Frankiaceae bacterium]|nr:hypothetical protein [Frankiaceae bacterium]